MSESEVQLIEEARKGNMDAFARLFEPYRPMVSGVAMRLVGPTDADDVLMDTFLKAWKAIPGFRGGSAIRTWLYRICSNCAHDCLRARQRRPVSLDEDADGEGAKGMDSDAAAHEIAAAVDAALRKLSDEHRATLLLRFADGLSYSEIAAATGVAIGTVMSRLFHARRNLKRILREVADETPPPLAKERE